MLDWRLSYFALEDGMAYVFGQPFLVGQLPVIPQVPIVPQPLSSQQVVYQKQPEPISEEKLQEKGSFIRSLDLIARNRVVLMI